MIILLDTHIWVWWLTSDRRLSKTERSALDQGAERGELRLSGISLWEAQMLHAKKRLELPLPLAEWLELATDSRMLKILPLDIGVILALDALPAGFHGDPADRVIVATARAHALPLATRDVAIRKSRLAKLWRP